LHLFHKNTCVTQYPFSFVTKMYGDVITGAGKVGRTFSGCSETHNLPGSLVSHTEHTQPAHTAHTECPISTARHNHTDVSVNSDSCYQKVTKTSLPCQTAFFFILSFTSARLTNQCQQVPALS
jgi:hypothetical protein